MSHRHAAATDQLTTGGEWAWDNLFREFGPLIDSVASSPQWHFAHEVREDLQQRIRRDLMQALKKQTHVDNLAGFVKTLAVRRCIDHVRREVREKGLFCPLAVKDDADGWKEPDIADESCNPVDEVVRHERARVLREYVDRLEDWCQTAIREFYIEEHSYKSIARRHGISVNTVGSRLSRCLARLRDLMKDLQW